MNQLTLSILLFAAFAIGLPTWLMQNNKFHYPDNHSCTGECYEQWKAETGGVVAVANATAAAAAAASPVELGSKLYQGCIACHGAKGEGGIGPQLSGQSAASIASMLQAYKNGETRGAQSNMMWGQAAALSAADMENMGAFIESL